MKNNKIQPSILPGFMELLPREQLGISIGLTRLFFVLKEIGFIDNYELKNSIDYLIIPLGNTVEYCGELIKNHIMTQIANDISFLCIDFHIYRAYNIINEY